MWSLMVMKCHVLNSLRDVLAEELLLVIFPVDETALVEFGA
jgi:hypothetical protein